MQIKFIAQSGFIIKTEDSKIITIDLWPDNPINPVDFDDIPKTDYVFCTHDHTDHGLPAAIKLAKRDDSIFISNYDIMQEVHMNGVEKIAPGSIGGWYKVGDIEIQQVHAEHSSAIGLAIGFLIKVDNKIIYHMGDTGYFSTLKDIGEMYDIDLLMVPIGSRYTMGPYEASFAVRDLKPKVAIPIHYNTSDKIKQDPEDFVKAVKGIKSDTEVKVLKPGEEFIY